MVSAILADFDEMAADLTHDWQLAMQDILQAMREANTSSELDHTTTVAIADHDLAVSVADSLTDDLNDLSSTNGSPWAEFDADTALSQAGLVEIAAGVTKDRILSDANALAAFKNASSAAHRTRGAGQAAAESDARQSEANEEEKKKKR